MYQWYRHNTGRNHFENVSKGLKWLCRPDIVVVHHVSSCKSRQALGNVISFKLHIMIKALLSCPRWLKVNMSQNLILFWQWIWCHIVALHIRRSLDFVFSTAVWISTLVRFIDACNLPLPSVESVTSCAWQPSSTSLFFQICYQFPWCQEKLWWAFPLQMSAIIAINSEILIIIIFTVVPIHLQRFT